SCASWATIRWPYMGRSLSRNGTSGSVRLRHRVPAPSVLRPQIQVDWRILSSNVSELATQHIALDQSEIAYMLYSGSITFAANGPGMGRDPTKEYAVY